MPGVPGSEDRRAGLGELVANVEHGVAAVARRLNRPRCVRGRFLDAYEGQIARRQVFVLQVHNDQAAVSRNAPVLPRHRAGIFTVLSSDEDCLLLEDNDRHLRVQLALRWDFSLNQDELIISTVVHVHNAFGRAYMVPVVPTHRLIMPLLLGRLGGQ